MVQNSNSLLYEAIMFRIIIILCIRASLAEAESQDAGPPMYVFNQAVSVSMSRINQQETSKDGTDLLETILTDEVTIATCQATCARHFPRESCKVTRQCKHCQRVCRLLVETPAWENICSAPGLCHQGCQVACEAGGDDLEERTPRHHEGKNGYWEIKLFGCHLFWENVLGGEDDKEMDFQGIQYLIAYQDRYGKFYHHATLETNFLELKPEILAKVDNFVVLAIGQDGVIDTFELQIESSTGYRDCLNNVLEPPTEANVLPSPGPVDDPKLPTAILATVSTLFVLAIGALATTIIQQCKEKKEFDTFENVKEGIENDFEIYSEHEECGQDCKADYYISHSVLI